MPNYGSSTPYGFQFRYGDSDSLKQTYEQNYIHRCQEDTLAYCRYIPEYDYNVASADTAQDCNAGDDISHFGWQFNEGATSGDPEVNLYESGPSYPAELRKYAPICIECLFELDCDDGGNFVIIDTKQEPNGAFPRIIFDGNGGPGSVLEIQLDWTGSDSFTNYDFVLSTTPTGWNRFLLVYSVEDSQCIPSTGHRVEIGVFNLTNGTFDKQVVYTPAVAASGETPAQGWANDPNAYYSIFNISTGIRDHIRPIAFRVSDTFHTMEQAYHDWVAPDLTTTTLTHPTRQEVYLPDRNTVNIHNDEEFAGPTYIWTAADQNQKDTILLSSMQVLRGYNEQFTRIEWLGTTGEANNFTPAPGSGTHYFYFPHLYHLPAPTNANSFRVTAHMTALYDNASGSDGAFDVGMYSMGYVPTRMSDTDSVYIYSRNTVTINTHDTVTSSSDISQTSTSINADGGGAWYDFGYLPIITDRNGFCYLCLSRNQNGSGGEYRYLFVNSLCIEPSLNTPNTSVMPIRTWGPRGWGRF